MLEVYNHCNPQNQMRCRLWLAHFTDKETEAPKFSVDVSFQDHTGSDDKIKTDPGRVALRVSLNPFLMSFPLFYFLCVLVLFFIITRGQVSHKKFVFESRW